MRCIKLLIERNLEINLKIVLVKRLKNLERAEDKIKVYS